MHGTLCEEEAEMILRILLPRKSQMDEVIWNYDTRGHFSVKSVYYLGLALKSNKECSSSSLDRQKLGWKKVWKINV